MSSLSETATLAHGYTMAEVNRIARAAVNGHWRSRRLDDTDRMDCAWHAIVVKLYTSAEPPDFYDLFYAAMDALTEEVHDDAHHHGWTTHGAEEAPNFTKFWISTKRHSAISDGFSEHLCEVLALPAVLGTLSPEEYEAISSLAAFDNDFAAAAEALGLKYGNFRSRVVRARKKIAVAWYDDETPPTRTRRPDACRYGHSRAEHSTKGPDGRLHCRVCNRNRWRRRKARQR